MHAQPLYRRPVRHVLPVSAFLSGGAAEQRGGGAFERL